MKPVAHMKQEELKYAIQDCYEAVKAMPQNPKAIAYLQDARAAEDELRKRARVALNRAEVHRNCFDRLAFGIQRARLIAKGLHPHPTRIRKHARAVTAYEVDRFRSACWLLGHYRLYGLV